MQSYPTLWPYSTMWSMFLCPTVLPMFYPAVWPHNLHHQPRACPCRVPRQPTLLPAPILLSTQNCKKYIGLVISAIKTHVMMNFNLLIVRDPVIFPTRWARTWEGGLRLAVIYLRPVYSTVLFSNPWVGFQFLAIELCFNTLL